MTGDPDPPGELAALQRLYADAGGVAHLPEALRACLPRHKHDLARVDAIAALGFPAIAAIVPHLLTWLQDANWPVSRPVERVLAGIGEPLVDPVRAVLRSSDDVWKYWVLGGLVRDSAALRVALGPELRRIADTPTPGERAEEVDRVALELLR